MNHLQKVPLLASRAFSSSSRQLKNKVPEAQKFFQNVSGAQDELESVSEDRKVWDCLLDQLPPRPNYRQEDNGLPVHIKGGTKDVLLYRATMTLTVVGTGYSLYLLLVASMPKKKT